MRPLMSETKADPKLRGSEKVEVGGVRRTRAEVHRPQAEVGATVVFVDDAMPSRPSAHWGRDELRLSLVDHRSTSLVSIRSRPQAQDDIPRNIRLTRVTTGGGAIAKTADGSRVAVAGRECASSGIKISLLCGRACI